MGTPDEFERIARRALACRECFRLGEVVDPPFDLAQPRWIGFRYWNTSPCVAILMLNPGTSPPTAETLPILTLYRYFRDGRRDIGELLKHERQSMPTWGRPPGRFVAFYLEGIGLDLDETAFVNIAWCATRNNHYPVSMLDRCFERHTKQLLEVLNPHILLVSGVRAWAYCDKIKIERFLPDAKVAPMLHYAHRRGRAREVADLKRVRAILEAQRNRPEAG